MRKEILGDKHPSVANSLHNVGHTYIKLGNYTEGIKLLKESYDIFQSRFGDDHPHTILVKKSLEKLDPDFIKTLKQNEIVKDDDQLQELIVSNTDASELEQSVVGDMSGLDQNPGSSDSYCTVI